jgi:VWFA-related protein
MKLRHFCFGVLWGAVWFSSAQADVLGSLINLFTKPAATHGVAVPRPIGGHTLMTQPSESDAGLVASPATGKGEVLPEPLLENARPSDGFVREATPEILPAPVSPGWDGKRLSILGIDRSNFPNLLILLSVKDANGLPSLEVNPNGFELTEDEAPQLISGVEPCVPKQYPGGPLGLALLIDSSGSMQRYMDVVLAAATRFTQRLRDEDQMAVVGFNNRPQVLTPMTTSQKKMIKAINTLYPRGFTALYDAISTGVENVKACPGEKAMVLLTDGKDDDGTGVQLSHTPLETALKVANRAHVPIYVIGIGNEIAQDTLQRIADETGGSFHFTPKGEDLNDLYIEIARELGRGDEGYYKILYRASEDEKDGSERTVIIRYEGFSAVATYPAPRNLWWPFPKPR